LLRQVAGPRRVGIGDRHEIDRRIFRREPRAQAADATRTDDGDAQRFRSIIRYSGLIPASRATRAFFSDSA